MLVCLASIKKYPTPLWSECTFLVLFTGLRFQVLITLEGGVECAQGMLEFPVCGFTGLLIPNSVLIPPFHRLLPRFPCHPSRQVHTAQIWSTCFMLFRRKKKSLFGHKLSLFSLSQMHSRLQPTVLWPALQNSPVCEQQTSRCGWKPSALEERSGPDFPGSS